MYETVKLILSLSIAGGLFSLVLLAMKPFMRNRLSKSFQYYIWLVVLLRFILPFSFGINLMDFTFNTTNIPLTAEKNIISNNYPVTSINNNHTVNNNVPGNYPNATKQQAIAPISPLSTNSLKQFDIITMLACYILWIWLAGAIISISLNIIGYFQLKRYIHGSAYALDLSCCKVKVFKSCYASTPMLVGVIKPRIYLPDIEYADVQLKNILLHELIHMRRHDILLKWVVALVVSVHWFNPIVYFLRRECNRACELACDEAVIQNLDDVEKQSYGDTLITVVAESRQRFSFISTTMCDEKKKLKERLVAIMSYKKKTKITVLITVVLTVVIMSSALIFGASAGTNNQKPETEENGLTIVSQNDDGIHFHIDKIMPNEVICLGKIELKGDVIYTLKLTSEFGYGRAPFTALNESPDVTSPNGVTWRQLIQNSSSNTFTNTFRYIDMESGYIYVGSTGNTITNVDAVLTFDYIDKKTQDIEYTISLKELRQFAAKGDSLLIEDFNNFGGQDIGFGLYILYFKVEGGYTLLVGNQEVTGKPFYVTLSIPGVEETIDIRYDDIDEFIDKYHVPNELRDEIYQYLDTIMSSPSLSSVTIDYIAAHLNEYTAIWNMA